MSLKNRQSHLLDCLFFQKTQRGLSSILLLALHFKISGCILLEIKQHLKIGSRKESPAMSFKADEFKKPLSTKTVITFLVGLVIFFAFLAGYYHAQLTFLGY